MGQELGGDRRWGVTGAVVAAAVSFGLVLASCGGSDDSSDAGSDSSSGAETTVEEATEDLSDGVEFEGELDGQVALRSVDLERGQALRVVVEPLDATLIAPQIYITAAEGPLFDLAAGFAGIDGGFSDVFSDAGFYTGGADLFSDVEFGSTPGDCTYGSSVSEAAFNLGVPLFDTEGQFDLTPEEVITEGIAVVGFGGTTNGGPTPAWLSFVAPADGTYNVVIKARDGSCDDVEFGSFRVRMQSADAPEPEPEDDTDTFDESDFDTAGAEIADSDEILRLLEFHTEFMTDNGFFPVDLLFSDVYGEDLDETISGSDAPRTEDLEPVAQDPDRYYGPPQD
jgi:hypothetical protein